MLDVTKSPVSCALDRKVGVAQHASPSRQCGMTCTMSPRSMWRVWSMVMTFMVLAIVGWERSALRHRLDFRPKCAPACAFIANACCPWG
jgi:hypothetical protein